MTSLKLRAVNMIQRATKPGKAGDREKGIPAVAPVIETIKPGTIFTASDETQFKELTTGPRPAAVAVKDDADDADDAKKSPAKKPPAKKAPAKKDEKPEGDDTQTGGEGDDTQTGGEGAEGEDDLV